MDGPTKRPTSPHATVYDPPIALKASVFHRLSGAFLYLVGVPIFTWYMLALASGPDAYDTFTWFASSWLGTCILFGISWCIFQHFASGLRHLVMDLGFGFDKDTSSKTAYLTFVFSFVMTGCAWIALRLF